jgi:hypothetical protein
MGCCREYRRPGSISTGLMPRRHRIHRAIPSASLAIEPTVGRRIRDIALRSPWRACSQNPEYFVQHPSVAASPLVAARQQRLDATLCVLGNIQTSIGVFQSETDVNPNVNLEAPPVARGNRTMMITYHPAALLLVLSLATPTADHQSPPKKSSAQAHAYGTEGHEIVAPPWSAACMTDHGPSECGEPMWVYGSSNAHARSTNGF